MKITPSIHAVKIPFEIPVAPGKTLDRFVYTYIIIGRKQTCLIDSAVSGARSIIKDFLLELGKNISDISLLLLTHAHPDHIGEAQVIRNESNCRVETHPAARGWVEDIDKQFEERPVPGFHSLVGGSVKVDQLLNDDEMIDLGDISLQVVYTPGHSRCSISLYCEEEGVLFAGDAIPQGNDLPIYEDVAAAVASIRRLQKIEGVKYLLASWSDPQLDADPYRIMDNGLDYFQKIHTAIRQLPGSTAITDPMELCKKMVTMLSLPEVAINPLIAKSFASHLPLLDQEEL